MKLLSALTLALLVLFATPFLSTPAQATTHYTATATYPNTSGAIPGYVGYAAYSFTFVASGDTVYCNLGKFYPSIDQSDTTWGELSFQTSTLNGDSISLAVRYEQSWDNVNWKSYTVGTDSTTWTTTVTGSNYAVQAPYLLTERAHGLPPPYTRVKIYGYTAYNVAGTKVKVFYIQRR